MSVEALLVERLDGGEGTDGTQIKPSTLISGREGAVEELGDAARVLDGKLGRLWAFVASDCMGDLRVSSRWVF